MPNHSLIYLASPYSHPDDTVRQARFDAVCRAAGRMMANGALVFSPIAHSHPIAEYRQLPTDFGYWEAFDRTILGACKALVVLTLDGWEQSKGVAAEVDIALSLRLPVTFETPHPSDLL